MKGRILIAGFTTRHVAQSASRAGYEVYAVDHFCDQDLSWFTKDRIKFDDLDDLPDAVSEMCRRHVFDLLVVTSGAEDLHPTVPLCGTPKDKVERFLDKLEIQHFFEIQKVPSPRLLGNEEYPAMVKPRHGSGGWRNAIVRNEKEFQKWNSLYSDVPSIRQQVIEGVPASVCCVADGRSAKAVATNEQLLRGTGESAFGFCGSITPFDHPLNENMISIATRIAASSGCVGTVGIDFVVGDTTPYAIEINPRFQGTVDTVEIACGCNLFQFHIDACFGILKESLPFSTQFAARKILFADRDITMTADLKHLVPVVADIPWPGTFFEEEQAIVSVYGWGPTRETALSMLDKHISTVRQYMR